MKKYRYKEIEKNLSEKHGEIAFQVTLEVRKLGLNSIEFKEIREKIYLEAEALVDKQMPSNNAFQKRLEQVSARLTSKAIKKTKLEVACNIVFVVFAILTICFPIIYGMNFKSNLETNNFYSSGIYFYVKLSSLFPILLCFFTGVIVTMLFQSMEKSKKTKVVITTLVIALGCSLVLQGLTTSFPDAVLTLNFILVEAICLVLSVSSFFLENYISQREYNNKGK